MGQQQLLLIILGIIIVGIAIFIGVNLFKSNAVEAKRNNVTNELVNLAASAQQYYLRPAALGGGSQKFTGWKIPPQLVVTANGHYAATIYADSVSILGVGNEVVTGGDSVQVKITVSPGSYRVKVIN